MLPSGHIEWTWAGLNLLQRTTGRFADADYRLVALAAVAPDLIDKPLAWFVFPEANAALFFSHTLLAHGLIWGAAWATGRLESSLPYLLAFSGHLVLDRMWWFSRTLLWPLRGRGWHQWQHVGTPTAMFDAYREVIRKEPILVMLDAAGAALLAWFAIDRKLYSPDRLRSFLSMGRFPGATRWRGSESAA